MGTELLLLFRHELCISLLKLLVLQLLAKHGDMLFRRELYVSLLNLLVLQLMA